MIRGLVRILAIFLIIEGFIALDVAALTLTDLETTSNSNAFGVNNIGQVVGLRGGILGSYLTYNATIWDLSTGVITDLGMLPLDIGTSDASVAHDINDKGQVVGWTSNASFLLSYGTLWDLKTGYIHGLGYLFGYQNSFAYSINNNGLAVGENDPPCAALLWSSSGTPLGLGLGLCVANDINDAGQIVGESFISGNPHATLWNSSSITYLSLPGETESNANSINNLGQIAGFSNAHSTFNNDAIVWTIKTTYPFVTLNVTVLGKLPGGTFSIANGINNKGQVVGQGDNATGIVHGILWNISTGAITDLGVPKGMNANTITVANAINDLGIIVGSSRDTSGSPVHALVWTTRLKGDADDNGLITVSDALLYLRYAVGKDISPYHLFPVVDDVTCEKPGMITVADALKVLRKAVGQKVDLNC